jgi:hypothetical protein
MLPLIEVFWEEIYKIGGVLSKACGAIWGGVIE